MRLLQSTSITYHASFSLRSRQLEEIGKKKKKTGRARDTRKGSVSCVACFPLTSSVLSCACYFRLLRKLCKLCMLGIE